MEKVQADEKVQAKTEAEAEVNAKPGAKAAAKATFYSRVAIYEVVTATTHLIVLFFPFRDVLVTAIH